ncbi:MAG: TetR/AcrR family transcriptional regulator [Proteobacteria bacterium]|nr:TetR/AcrR family transcriptional regulator [Pseudomonadota bacterium]
MASVKLKAPTKKQRQEMKNATKSRAVELTVTALDLFAERDFASVTIKDIANACGVNTALIYYYFENKEDLFRATIENAITEALENYTNLRKRHDDPVDLINDWFDTNLELSGSIRKLVKVMLDYSGSRISISSIDSEINNFYDVERSILSDSIRRGIEQGIFHAADPDRLALFVSTHLDGIMVAAMIRKDFNLDTAMAALREILWFHLGFLSDRIQTRHRQDGDTA